MLPPVPAEPDPKGRIGVMSLSQMAAAPRTPAEPGGLEALVLRKELHDEMSPKERPSMVMTKEKAAEKMTSPAGGVPRKDKDPEKVAKEKVRKERRDPRVKAEKVRIRAVKADKIWKTGFAEKSARISKRS